MKLPAWRGFVDTDRGVEETARTTALQENLSCATRPMCWQAPYALRLSAAHLKPTPAAVRFIRKHHGAARAGAANVRIRRRGERRRLQAALGCERLKPADGQRVENGFRKSLGTGCLLQQVFKLSLHAGTI